MKDLCVSRLIKFLQLWHRSTKRSFFFFSFFLLPSSETLEAPALCDANLLCLNPAQKSHISSALSACVRRATSVSIIATVMQNVGETHKCQILFSQSGCMSVALCGLSFSRALQRLFKKPQPSASYKSQQLTRSSEEHL